jgi:hypothetical protein
MTLVFEWLVMLAQTIRNKMRLKHNLILLLVCCSSVSIVYSQDSTTDQASSVAAQEPSRTATQREADEGDPNDQSESQAEQEVPQPKQQKESKTKPPKQVFKPTEEISEDSPVPFPVDI